MKLFARFHGRQSKPEEHEIIPAQAEPIPLSALQELTGQDLEQVSGGTLPYFEMEIVHEPLVRDH